MTRFMQEQQDHTVGLHNNHLVEKLNLVVKDLEKWKFGHYMHMVLLISYKKFLQLNQMM